MPGTTQHNLMLDWLDSEFSAIPGVTVRDQPFTMPRWQGTTESGTLPGRDLAKAGRLRVAGDGRSANLQAAGAIAYSAPTTERGVTGPVVYLPRGVAITPENAAGKIILRDVPPNPIPNRALLGLAHYASPDALDVAGAYDRPYTVTGNTADIDSAASAGALGIIQAFNVPTHQVRGYFDPHFGTLQSIPGIWVGSDTRDQLKQLADSGTRVRIDVLAEVDQDVSTHNVVATLPGLSSDTITLVTNTDGNTWVQENSSAALIGLAEYFASLPLACRPKTIEFALTSAHLAYKYDGVQAYRDGILDSADEGHVDAVFAVEHLGTREILPVSRPGRTDQRLALTGKPETYAWFAPTESPAISAALTTAVIGRDLSNTAVLRGMDAPRPGRVPLNCNFGGLANPFHHALIPSLGGISGPWTLWASTFGESALDYGRMRTQALVVGDTVLTLSNLTTESIAGGYPAERELAANGATRCQPAQS